jgi:hypothetical protein
MPGKHRNRGSNRDFSVLKGTHLSAIQRVEILTLFHRAKWSKMRISRELQIARSTVISTIARGIVTPDRPIGRKPILTTQKRKRLTARATLNAAHRRMTYEEIAEIEGIQACKRTLIKAFEKEQYHRRKSTENPLLTEEHRIHRLAWANLHKSWDFSMWKRVDWTNKSTFRIGGFGDVWVT